MVPFIDDALYGLTLYDFLRGVGCDTSQLDFLRDDDIGRSAVEFESTEVWCIIIVTDIDVIGCDEFQVGSRRFLFREMSSGRESHDGCSLVLQHRAGFQTGEVIPWQRPVSLSGSHEVGHGKRQELTGIVLTYRFAAIIRLLSLLIGIAAVERCPRVVFRVRNDRAFLVG